MVDIPDLKSGGGNPVWVQVPPPAPTKILKKIREKTRKRRGFCPRPPTLLGLFLSQLISPPGWRSGWRSPVFRTSTQRNETYEVRPYSA